MRETRPASVRVLTNVLIVLVNGLIVVADAVVGWAVTVIGLVIVTQFTRWEIAFDQALRGGGGQEEELL